MVKKNLNKVFLAASIPLPDRDRKFYDTADIIAIRDSVRALATVVIPNAKLIWGGHPAITPLIRFVLSAMKIDLKEHVTLYQSKFFEKSFPKDNFFFEDIKLIPANINREKSMVDLRNVMIKDNDFKVGIFIGGMEGVIEEFKLFQESHPNALLLPFASTGAAAKLIYDNMKTKLDVRLKNDYAYMSLLKDLLRDYI